VLGSGGVVGVLTGPLVTAAIRRVGAPRLIGASVVVSGLATVALGLAPGFVAALLANLWLSLAIWVSVTSMIGERQRHAPHRMQARVGMTGRMIAIASQTAGSVAASLLATQVPLRALFVAFGLATLTVAAWAVPRLLRATARRTPEPARAPV
jgi:hypothetical protein